jgi:hypothetical protein
LVLLAQLDANPAFAAVRASRVHSMMRQPTYSSTNAITERTNQPAAAVVASTSGSLLVQPKRKIPPCRRVIKSASKAGSTNGAHNLKRISGLDPLAQFAAVAESGSKAKKRNWGWNL